MNFLFITRTGIIIVFFFLSIGIASGTKNTQNQIIKKADVSASNVSAGRLAGESSGTVSGYALSTMTINGNTVSDGGVNGEGKTVDELKSQTLYEALGWDFEDVWKMSETYPIFKWIVATPDFTPKTADDISLSARFNNAGVLIVDSDLEIRAVMVFDVSGKIIFSQRAFDNANIEIPANSWNSGLYFIKATTSEGIGVVKVLKHSS